MSRWYSLLGQKSAGNPGGNLHDMASKRDYYDILGVPRAASKEDVKKAFRQLARKYHPDVSKEPDAEARFKEINEAYSVLSDDEQRARYDRFGHAGVDDSIGFTGGFPGFEEIFADFFGGFRTTTRRARRRRGRDLQTSVTIDFEEAVFGVKKEIEITRQETCPVCGGSGAEPGTSPRRCPECNGVGEVQQVRQTLLGSMIYANTCPRCQGRGEVIDTPCRHCNGSGRARVTRRLHVTIPPGIDDGMQVRLTGEGEPGDPSVRSGDLYVDVRVRPHPFFQRRNHDLMLELSINVAQAALGDKIKVPTLDGEQELIIPAGTQSGKVMRMRGLGVPRLRSDGSSAGRGDQLVIIEVATPTNLTEEQRRLFEELSRTLGHEVTPQKAEEKGLLARILDWLGGEQR